eukprot:TRINITY_DN8961_c0_g1_i1.p1 TRINITY_DN8961_c0_g1~~TRINITY_DN8961_c0_g1_i1.p1  ORF type:complete len:696 (-),score=231.57 TRINITY_DN8961_c0_g1_i1:70-2157(-)
MMLHRLRTMARPSTSMRLLRGLKNMSKSQLKNMPKSQLEADGSKYEKLDIANSVVCQEMLNRVQVVTEVSDSKDIVENILAMGQPVAVDMEGLNEGITSMVQVCDVERNISLFRTGANHSLFWEGGLAKLLQTPEVMKIMHGSTMDCLSIYKDGVKLWNLYDTSVAYKVLDYQLHGTSVYSSPQIGFNKICRHFGLPENPVKDKFKNILWRMMITKNGERGIDTVETLDDELILYCAWDVEPLHQLHDMLTSAISSPYSHLVRQLSEVEIIRAIDPDLAKKKRSNLKNMEVCNMFLSDLPSTLTPPDLYSSLAHLPGHKHIYFSHSQGTANIILDSRVEVVNAFKNFSDWGIKLGDEVQCKLVVEAHDNEIIQKDDNHDSDDEVVNTTLSGFTSPRTCQQIMKSLIKANCPVVVDFMLYPDCSALEIYVGTQPSIKVLVNQEMVELGGLGEFLSSDVVKIVPRLDTSNVHTALKMLKMRNVFAMDTAVKSLDYLEHGQSLFKQPSKKVEDMSKTIGLDMSSTRLHWHYLAYLHLIQTIPNQFQELLAELADLEIGVGSYQDNLGFKDKRKQFKARLDGRCIHLRLIGKVDKFKQKKLKDMLVTTMLRKNLSMVEYLDLGRCAIVELTSLHAVKTLMEELENRKESSDIRFSCSHPQVLRAVVEKPARPVVDVGALEVKLNKNLDKLRASGLMDIL